MNIVPKAIKSPHHCAVFPHIGSAQPEGYFDTGTNLPGPGIHTHSVYVSVVAVKELARKLSYVSPEELARVHAQVETLARENALLREQLAEADRFAEAAEYTLNKFDSRVRRKPGPQKAVA